MIFETLGILLLGVIMIIMIINQQVMMKRMREKLKNAELEYKENDYLKRCDVDIPDADWIWDGTNSANSWMLVRKKIVLDKTPEKVSARVAADSKYRMWINGKLTVCEGGLKRGPVKGGTYCDIFDLDASAFVAGENVIAFEVWYFGKNGFSHVSSAKAGMIFSIDVDGVSYRSDGDVKVKREYAYFNGLEGYDFKPNYRLSESNVFYDSRIATEGFFYNNFDDSTWGKAVVMGKCGAEPWGKLYRRPIPMWYFGEPVYIDEVKTESIHGGKKYTYSLPKNMQFNILFEVAGAGNAHIVYYTDNFKIDLEQYLKHVYVLRAGKQSYENPLWISGSKLIMEVPDGVEVIRVGYRPVGYDAKPVGDFDCSDADLVKLWTKAVNTLEINMHDSYTDCPDRERAQWTGDAVNSLEEAFCCLHTNAADLAKKCFENIAGWEHADGVIETVPANGLSFFELPDQNLALICGMENYYANTGDRETLEICCGVAVYYLKLWKIKKNGMPAYRKGQWDWPDWGVLADKAVIQVCWYYMALNCTAKMAEELGRFSDIEWCRARADAIEQNFKVVFGKSKGYSSSRRYDDRANALAVCSGLGNVNLFSDENGVLFKVRNSSPYMERYVCQALCKCGRPDLAIRRIKERFAEQIADDYTTLSEYFSPKHGSVNHAWSGGILPLLERNILGVKPTVAGYAAYEIAPVVDLFDKLANTIDTVKGKIKVALSRENGKTVVTVETDVDNGKVMLPEGFRSSVGTCASETIDISSGKNVFVINAGKYVFEK